MTCDTLDAKDRGLNMYVGSLETTLQDAAAIIYKIFSQSSCILSEMFPCLNEDTFISMLHSIINISTTSSRRSECVTAEICVQN